MADRVSLQEAARRLGVSVRTVQRRIAAGELDAETVVTPRGQRVVVTLPTEIREPADTVTTPDSDVSALLAEVRAERDWLRGRVETLETTVRGLTIALSQAQQIAQLGPVGDTAPDSDTTPTRQSDVAVSQPPSLREGSTPQPRQERRRPPRLAVWVRRWLGL